MTNPQHEALVEAVARALAKESGVSRWENVPEHGEDGFDWSSRDYWKRLAIAALSATAATPSDEEVRLRAALEVISEGDVPRTEGKKWREDGAPSKYDQCSHGVWMHEDCGECTSDFARAALEPQAKDL